MAARLQSPISHLQSQALPLGSNDDELERARARAARAYAVRRKSAAHPPLPAATAVADLLDRDQIMALFHNCIKLASENKINQKNTWELDLIDHLSEIVRVKSDEDDETNFQQASCTLEAGVKIYSLRVDSMHSTAYKVLGGLNRAGREEDEEDEQHETQQVENLSKKVAERKMSPLSTLESSVDALNIKKFDVAFTVDPLYHQTSAQFDEGGAKGLLLNNLGVYGGCRVLFDSLEIPETSISREAENEKSEVIDLSFVKEYIRQMMSYMPVKYEISPTLRDIVDQFDEDNRRPSDVFCSVGNPAAVQDGGDYDHAELEANEFGDSGFLGCDHDEDTSVVDENFANTYTNFGSHSEENEDYILQGSDVDDKLEKIAGFLSLGLGFTSRTNAWAGPDHWKYQKVKGLHQAPATASESELEAKKVKNPKVVSDIDFTISLKKDMLDIFAPPKNPKLLLLSTSKLPCNITLPEDCHYRPDSLVKLFILPNLMCLGKKGRKFSEVPYQQNDSSDPIASWDNACMNDDQFDDVNNESDVENTDNLVCQPRQVSKVDIQYDKVSKQVDVHALKDMLWNHLQESIQMSSVMESQAMVSLKQILRQFPSEGPAAASIKDVSPHLFFICLLHLANEHGLSIRDRPSLDELDITIPASALV